MPTAGPDNSAFCILHSAFKTYLPDQKRCSLTSTALSGAASTPEILRASLSSFLIGFSGLSILAQCCSFIAKTDINTKLYILSKFLHGCFASIFTFLLYPILKSDLFVSNFDNVYNVIYDNSLYNFYINNYSKVLPVFIIIYILIILSIIEKNSYSIKKES